MYFSKIDNKGRVVIPSRIRNKININDGTLVIFTLDKNKNIKIKIVPKNYNIEKALGKII